MKISKLIYNQRIKLGITQKELAKYLGYSTPQFISIIENGRALLPLKSVKKMSKVLKIKSNDLYEMAITERIDRMKKRVG